MPLPYTCSKQDVNLGEITGPGIAGDSSCEGLGASFEMDMEMGQDRKSRLLFSFLFLAHAGFIVYGSLVPFVFEPVPLARAWAEFRAIISGLPRNFSKANLLANVLIGIPGTFLFLGVFHKKSARPGLITLAIALLYSTLLASTAEFLQLFTSTRITMLSDIIAQTAGGVIGLICWLWVGPYTRTMLGALILHDRNYNTGSFIFFCYLIILFLIYSLPLDLSPKLGALYRQWIDGKIVLVPFSNWSSSHDIFRNLPAVVLWVPVGWFLTRIRNWSLLAACIAVYAGTAFLEFMQIFILSRTTDATNIVLGTIGGFAGGISGSRTQKQIPETDSCQWKKIFFVSFLFMGWFVFVVIVFWMPFSFSFEREFLLEKVREIGVIPLRLYLGKPYLHSAYNILTVIVYFIPFGVFFSSFVSRHFSGDSSKLIYLLFLLVAGLLAGLLEFGQVFIPGRYPDITDWVFMVAGAILGHSVSNMLGRRGTNIFHPKDKVNK